MLWVMFQNIWFVLFAAAFTSSSSMTVSANVIDAQELAIGDWNVTMRGGLGFDPSSLFPPTSPVPAMDKRQKTTHGRNRKLRKLECFLSIRRDGSFSIVPRQKEKEMKDEALPSILSNPRGKEGLLAIRGRWKILANPYCATDRFYDQLVLESYPRAEKQLKRVPGAPSDEIELQKVGLVLHSRLWGRYSAGGAFRTFRPNYARGRLTHGILTWEKKESTPSRRNKLLLWLSPKPVVVSFSGVRPSNQPEDDNFEDTDLFGY